MRKLYLIAIATFFGSFLGSAFGQTIKAIHLGGNWGYNRINLSNPSTPYFPDDFFKWVYETNVEWVGLSVSLHLDNSLDSTVELAYNNVQIPTFTDNVLNSVLEKLKSENLKVFVTLAFEIQEAKDSPYPLERWQLGYPDIYNSSSILLENWPWALDHPDHTEFLKSFFNSYTSCAQHIAEICEQNNVELFSLGTETDLLFRTRSGNDWPDNYRNELKAMVDSVRKVYSGKISYDMFYDNLINNDWWGPGSNHLWEDLNLDVVGVSAYFPLLTQEPDSVVSTTFFSDKWQEIFDNYLVPLKNRNPNLPIYFLEFGYVNDINSPFISSINEFQPRNYSDQNLNGINDEDENQANLYHSFFNILNENPGIVEGAFLWGNEIADEYQYDNDWNTRKHFGIRNKPVENIVKEFYKPDTTLTSGNTSIPVIVNRTPQLDQIIYAGDSLRFSVNAKDSENNHLFYKWYVNNVLDTLTTYSMFQLHSTRPSPDTVTVRVEISDGTNTVSTAWEVTIKPFIYQKILFDESHNERNTISDTKAEILNPEHPDWISFSSLKSKLIKDFIVESYESGTISTSLLMNYDVLILPSPDNDFTVSEINSIVSFVNEGGGLCFLGDAGLNPNINLLLQNFGITFNNSLILSPGDPWQDLANPEVLNFINHSALGQQPQFLMNWGGSFNVTPPAIALGSSANLSWRDLDFNMVQNANEPSAPYTIISAAVYGMGKVFCISDNSLHNDYLKWNPNDKLFFQAMKWLTGPPSAPNLLSPANLFYGTSTNTKLEWASVGSTNNYRIQVSRSQDFKSIFIDTLVNDLSVQISKLSSRSQYYWRVNAIDNDGEGKWSEVWSFKTKAFSFIANTGDSASISIPVSAIFQSIQIGDEIGVFTTQGLCVGSGIWENNELVITVWGDDGLTPEVDGIKAGEQFSYRIWTKATSLEQNIDCATYSQGDGVYTPNVTSIVSSMNFKLQGAGTISGKTNICINSMNEIYSIPPITGATSYFWSLPEGATGSSTTNSITVSFGASAVSGNISVKGQNECEDGASSTLAIIINPTYNIIENKTICAGQAYNDWTSSGTYKRTLQSTSGCDSVITTNLTILPVLPPAIIYVGDTLKSVESYQSYQWYDDQGIIPNATAKNLIIGKSGKYYLEITDNNGCTQRSAELNLIYTNSRISDFPKFKYSIIPNPNTGQFSFRVELTPKDDFTLKLINPIGQVVESRKVRQADVNHDEKFDVTHLSKGMYLLIISSDWINATEKIVVQ